MDFIVGFLNTSLLNQVKGASVERSFKDDINISSDVNYYNTGVYQDCSETFLTLILLWVLVYTWLRWICSVEEEKKSTFHKLLLKLYFWIWFYSSSFQTNSLFVGNLSTHAKLLPFGIAHVPKEGGRVVFESWPCGLTQPSLAYEKSHHTVCTS